MKPIPKIIVAVAVLLEAVCKSFAQVSATASASGSVISPISFVKNADMNFGNVAISPTIAGTVVIAPAGTRTTGGAGGITLPTASGTVSSASFTVSGQASYTYAITLPASCSLSDGSSHTMTVNAFTSDPPFTGTLGTGGTQTLNVGATLGLSAAQATGTYTNPAGLPVTVNYN